MENDQANHNQNDPQPHQDDGNPGGLNPNGQGQHGQNQGNQVIQAEMEVLKAQMAEVIRVLSALRDVATTEAAVAGMNNPPPLPGSGISQTLQAVQWPPYGLPLGYTPPAADANPGRDPPC